VPVLAHIPSSQTTSTVSYCTSEQMDLLRQVFAEVDRTTPTNTAPNHPQEDR
jgi:hypothetical protein